MHPQTPLPPQGSNYKLMAATRSQSKDNLSSMLRSSGPRRNFSNESRRQSQRKAHQSNLYRNNRLSSNPCSSRRVTHPSRCLSRRTPNRSTNQRQNYPEASTLRTACRRPTTRNTRVTRWPLCAPKIVSSRRKRQLPPKEKLRPRRV